MFVKVRTKLNKTKLTEPNLTKPYQLSKPHQTWLNQTKPNFIFFLLCLWKSNLNWPTENRLDQTLPNQTKLTKLTKSDQTKPNFIFFFCVCENRIWTDQQKTDLTKLYQINQTNETQPNQTHLNQTKPNSSNPKVIWNMYASYFIIYYWIQS